MGKFWLQKIYRLCHIIKEHLHRNHDGYAPSAGTTIDRAAGADSIDAYPYWHTY